MMNKKAFTLIELIIVIAIIALIAAAVFVSVNPARRLGEAKDSIRKTDAVAIEKAIQNAIAANASVPSSLASLTENTPYMIVTEGAATSGTCNCNTTDTAIARADVVGDFVNYLAGDMPVDEDAIGDDTGYYITRVGNSFFVNHCNAYGDTYSVGTPTTVTCYFDDYDVGESWSIAPELMVDGGTGTDQWSAAFGSEVEKLTHSTCASETFTNISQVRVRIYATCAMSPPCSVSVRPVFGGTADGDNHTETIVAKNWYSWQDITSDTNAPGTWATSDVVNLDMDIQNNSGGTAVYKIDLEVTHIP